MFVLAAVHCVGKEGLSEELFEASGLESDSMLDNSLLAASVNGTDIALVLKNLPIRVSILGVMDLLTYGTPHRFISPMHH